MREREGSDPLVEWESGPGQFYEGGGWYTVLVYRRFCTLSSLVKGKGGSVVTAPFRGRGGTGLDSTAVPHRILGGYGLLHRERPRSSPAWLQVAARISREAKPPVWIRHQR